MFTVLVYSSRILWLYSKVSSRSKSTGNPARGEREREKERGKEQESDVVVGMIWALVLQLHVQHLHELIMNRKREDVGVGLHDDS